jgi:O-antigen/teichoic acid export membrane protein
MTGAARRDESVAAHGARWITVAFVIVGLLNYGYSLMLTRLLDVAAYSRFAAGQGLILWAATVATVSVPWVLAQSMARARSNPERGAAIRFAMLASAGSGVIAAAAVGVIATRFGGLPAALAVSGSTFVVFLGTATTGWLQGRQRMRTLSALYVGENVLKNLAGLLLVIVAGGRETGALAAFGIGGIVMLLRWPRAPQGAGRPWVAVLANRGLWRCTFRIAGLQGMVSLFAVMDVVLVAMLPGDRAVAASYQASAALSRIPLFVAGAVATAFFPLLSRHTTGGAIAARAVRMYAAVALPLTAVLATMPAVLLSAVFPAQYGPMATLLKFTAVAGLAAGGVALATAFLQAADDYSCLPWLGAGLAGYVVALLAGWRTGGITGLAAGAALGAVATLALLGYRIVRREGRGLLAGVPLVDPLAAAGALILLRPLPVLWLAAAALVGLRAGVRFGRPGARHARRPVWGGPRRRETGYQSAVSLLTDTVWRGTPREASDAELRRALTVARRNRVEGRLARAYPEQFPCVLAEIRMASELFTRNLHQATDHLRRAGIPAVLIKGGLRGDYVCTSIDLVVSEQDWPSALTALAGWSGRSAEDQLERSTRALFHPPAGPGLCLHSGLSWFGVPALPAGGLLARARRNGHGVLVPTAADYLRIWLAHALFQGLALDLCLLLAVRDLMRPAVVTDARTAASQEGWSASFDSALATAGGAIDLLDRGLPVDLPVPLSLKTATDHAHGRPRMERATSPDREMPLSARVVVARKRGVVTR